MEIFDATWVEARENNDQPPPNGFATGEASGDVKLTLREIMAAMKRAWNWCHSTRTVTKVGAAWTFPNPPALTDGMVLGMGSGVVAANEATSINGKKVYLATHNGLTQVRAANPYWDYVFFGTYEHAPYFFYFDQSLDDGAGGFVLCSQPQVEYVSESIVCPVTGPADPVALGTGKFTFRMPYVGNFQITSVVAVLQVAQTSGSPLTLDIKRAGSTIFSTLLTIDNGEKSNATAAAAYALNAANIVTDDLEVNIDVTQIGDGTARGLTVTLIGHQVT